jgi:hypothetical protein
MTISIYIYIISDQWRGWCDGDFTGVMSQNLFSKVLADDAAVPREDGFSCK